MRVVGYGVPCGLSDGNRRAQTKTIKRNCFASAFCYCKVEGCAERCDDPRGDALRPVIPARRMGSVPPAAATG